MDQRERNYGLEAEFAAGSQPRGSGGRWESPLTPDDVKNHYSAVIARGVFVGLISAVVAILLGWSLLVGIGDVVDDTPACPQPGVCQWGGD